MKQVAIMGATSHIAKGLIERFLRSEDTRLHLYARSLAPLRSFLEHVGLGWEQRCDLLEGYDGFSDRAFDTLINCVGVRAVGREKVRFSDYLTVTERFDNLALGYLRERNPEALYVSFSSGAVYGRGFSEPAKEDTRFSVAVNAVEPVEYYSIARLHAEAKHRAFESLRIVDLRVFSYFSRYLDLNDSYFLSDLLRAILEKRVLITDDNNMTRDYLHPDDLYAVVCRCMAMGPLNRSFDIRSARPVSKNEILDYFTGAYGLRYERRPRLEHSSATGAKENYYSIRDSLSQIGWQPRFTSMETLCEETRHILTGRPAGNR